MKLLFICVENTCRSQMAEGLARSLNIEAHSAGIRAGAGVNEDAVKVMREIEIDISDYRSKSIDHLAEGMNFEDFNFIISLCSADAQDVCPNKNAFVSDSENSLQAVPLNWNLEDPKGKSLEVYRRVRDEIKANLAGLTHGTSPLNNSSATKC